MISDRYPDRTAPLVLGWAKALDRAQELRGHGLAYPVIAFVMSEYHGWGFCADTWRHHLYERGEPKNPVRVAAAFLSNGTVR